MLYIKWLTESSNFAYDQGGVPVLKSQSSTVQGNAVS